MSISQHIRSDLVTIIADLKRLVNSEYFQKRDFTSSDANNFLESYYRQINSTTPIDRFFIQDVNGKIIKDFVSYESESPIEMNPSFNKVISETQNTLSTQFFDGFIGTDKKIRIAITQPILINNSNRVEYTGLVGVEIPASELTKYYGNIHDVQLQYIAVIDSKGLVLVHPIQSLLGRNFFDDYVQDIIDHNEGFNDLVRTVISGQPSSAIYKLMNVERLNAGYPVILNGKTQYAIFLVTPTSIIYSKINDIVEKERLQMLALIAGTISAVVALIIIMSKMNTVLKKEVQNRTRQIEESHKSLEIMNQKLKNRDKMQNEFIHTASHELRTPIQSLLGFSYILYKLLGDKEQYKIYIESLHRNAKRLKRLVDILLDVSQIENN